MEATHHKTATIRPRTSHLSTGHNQRMINESISDVILSTPAHGRSSVGQP